MRLKLSLAIMYSSNSLPWSVKKLRSEYLGLEAHISTMCRLSVAEKRRLHQDYWLTNHSGSESDKQKMNEEATRKANMSTLEAQINEAVNDGGGGESKVSANLAHNADKGTAEQWLMCLEKAENQGWRAQQPNVLAPPSLLPSPSHLQLHSHSDSDSHAL